MADASEISAEFEAKVTELRKKLYYRKCFFRRLSEKPPGFAEGYAEGLMEAYHEMAELINPDAIDPSGKQPAEDVPPPSQNHQT